MLVSDIHYIRPACNAKFTNSEQAFPNPYNFSTSANQPHVECMQCKKSAPSWQQATNTLGGYEHGSLRLQYVHCCSISCLQKVINVGVQMRRFFSGCMAPLAAYHRTNAYHDTNAHNPQRFCAVITHISTRPSISLTSWTVHSCMALIIL